MIIGNLWGLLGLLSLPVILALHIFRRRFKPKTVSTLFLFGPTQFNQSSGRTREKLRGSASLLAELLAACAFTWFLCDPHLNDVQQARHLICILDGHQRLTATDNTTAQHSAVSKIKAALTQLLDNLNDSDRVTLIRSGRSPQLLTASAVPVSQAIHALSNYQCDQAYHSLQVSIELASDLQDNSKQAQVLIFSDHRLATAAQGSEITTEAEIEAEKETAQIPASWQVFSYGSPAANSGFIDARWFNDERGQRLFVRILRSNDLSQRTLQIFNSDNQLIHNVALRSQPGMQQLSMSIPSAAMPSAKHAAQQAAIIHLRLSGTDHYRLDDSCAVIQMPRQRISVRVAQDIPQRDAFIRALDATQKATIVDNAAQIYISSDPDAATSAAAGTWTCIFSPGDDSAVIGPFLSRSGHPLLRDLDFTGVLWAQPQATADLHTQPSQPEHILLQAGSSSLISEQSIKHNKHIFFHINLNTSSLPRHPAWPSLIANLITWRQQLSPGLQYHQLSTSIPNRIVLPAAVQSCTLHFPDQESQVYTADHNNVIVVPPLQHPGIYAISLPTSNTRSSTSSKTATQANKPAPMWQQFIVHNLDQHSSDLSHCTTQIPTLHSGQNTSVQRIRSRLQHILPIALALLAALAAWLLYRREQGEAR